RWTHEPPEARSAFERGLMLHVMDTHWRRHLRAIDDLRESIHMSVMAQRDPLVEFRRESYTMFADLEERIKADIGRGVCRHAAEAPSIADRLKSVLHTEPLLKLSRVNRTDTPSSKPTPAPNLGRNDPCSCGSGKKYKVCCMRQQS
ncbi:MAG: SEC-C metal-binding domain-containing protein, partial [Verrucomicrobiota bacterium]